MSEVDFWSDDVKVRTRVWDDADGVHKMGWINPGDRVHVIELYPNGPEPSWARFDTIDAAGDSELEPFDDNYKQWWAPVSAFYGEAGSGEEPDTPPSLVGITAEEAGQALRTLIRFVSENL